MCLTGIGPAIAAVMTREVYYRQFDNRRQVAGFLGLATSPHDSGDVERSQGISRAGRGQVRGIMIQAAWLWLKHQPKSAITRWFVQRTAGQSGRIRRIMIVAVARKLAIALWRFLEGPGAARRHARQPLTTLVSHLQFRRSVTTGNQSRLVSARESVDARGR
jgi:transposase